MRYNLSLRIPEFAKIAKLLGEDTTGLSELAAAERAITAVERLRREIGIPERIRDIGGKPEQLPTFAKKSFAIKRLMLLNARQPTEAFDTRKITFYGTAIHSLASRSIFHVLHVQRAPITTHRGGFERAQQHGGRG